MKVLTDVPGMLWGVDKELTFIQALECCLKYMGDSADYDELACASGMAFALKWKKEVPCPSAGTMEDPLYMDRVFRFAGRTYKTVWAEDDDFEEALLESLDRGVPAIVQGGFNAPDFYVLSGYDPAGPVYYGRTPYDDSDDYAETNERPLRAIIIGEEWGDKLEGLERLYFPLHSALLAYDRAPPAEGDESAYEHSFEAFDKWIAHLMDETLWARSDEGKFNLHVHANEWVFDVLYTSRLAAARYLLRTANFHNRHDAQHIMYAGRMYYVIAKILHQRGYASFGSGHPEKGYPGKYLSNAENRLEWAHLIRKAAEQDRKAYEEIKAVLGGHA